MTAGTPLTGTLSPRTRLSESPRARRRACPPSSPKCPRLHALELPEVDLTALDSLPLGKLDHPLRTLDLHCERKFRFRYACSLTAEMLDRLFPSLRLPAVGPPPTGRGVLFGELEVMGWDAVVRMLHEMRAKRGRGREDGIEGANP